MLHISLPATLDLFSGETFWAIMYYISRTAAMIISLHVFEDDTVAKVTVSTANLIVFCLCWALPRSLLLRCFALWRNANLAGGFAGSFLVAVFVLFCLFLVMIYQRFWTTRVRYFTASHRLRNCKDRA